MQLKDINSCAELSNGIRMPFLGFGVHGLKEQGEFNYAVNAAIKNGYRHFDTAPVYGNEEFLGKVLKDSGISRDDLFVTTKLWKTDFGYDEAINAFDKSLQKLGMQYVDLYLIHWPKHEKLIETWAASEHIYRSGKVKAIGVSNFSIEFLDLLSENCTIKPMVNQFEHHPYLQQKELVRYCLDNEIRVEAHSPLMWGRITNDLNFKALAEKYRKSVSQIVLRWNLQKGIIVIPKSAKEERIVENSRIFDFEISEEDMAVIDGFDENRRIGGIPGSL
jgi:methylglyoxal/glyoxal reductase